MEQSYYHLQTKFAKVIFLQLSVILFTGGVSRPRTRREGCLSRGCLGPGPRDVSRSRPRGVSAQGVSKPNTQGVSKPTSGRGVQAQAGGRVGCIPASPPNFAKVMFFTTVCHSVHIACWDTHPPGSRQPPWEQRPPM